MTTPASSPAPAKPAAKPAPDPLAAAVCAIARHITGRTDSTGALTVFGLTEDQAQAITGRT